MNRLEKIKAKQEIYPVGGDEWGRGVGEDDVDWLIEQVEKLKEFSRDIYENWDCDFYSHRYDTLCRSCEAGKLLEKLNED